MHTRVRLSRRLARLSQTQLAVKLDVQRSAVSQWEAVNGKRPSTDHLCALAVATNVQVEWLATGRGRMSLDAEEQLDSIQAIDALVVHDPRELRLLHAYRELALKAQLALIEMAEAARERKR